VVRIGADSSINLSVKDISLDYMVDQHLAGTKEEATGSSNDAAQIASLRSSLDGLKKQKQAKIDELNNLRNNIARTAELEKNISQLNGERQRLIQRLNKMQDDQKARNRALDATRRRARLHVLLDADVICSTLSGSGHEVLEQFEFDTVVIDEAAQSIELSSLIPLKYRCTRCILVGGLSRFVDCVNLVLTHRRSQAATPNCLVTYGHRVPLQLFVIFPSRES
jgi:senataxin